MKRFVGFRLRKRLDDDLLDAINRVTDSSALSDLCRDGLRYMLGVQTTKRIEVREKRIEPVVRSIPSKPAIYTPKKERG